jgi:hypothetical protein
MLKNIVIIICSNFFFDFKGPYLQTLMVLQTVAAVVALRQTLHLSL